MKRTFVKDNTLSVSSVVGLSPRYHTGSPVFTIDDFNHMWQAEAETVYKKTGIYVSVVTTEASVIYREDSGCPTGGEKAVDVRADCNPLLLIFIRRSIRTRLYTILARCLPENTGECG